MSNERQSEKRMRILAAAREMFLRQGLRATTMEAIAKSAGMAKPTLYAEYSDKDAVFLAVLEQLVADKLTRFETELDRPGPLLERIGDALAAEFEVIASALAGSPHVDELFSAHRQGASLFADSERIVRDRLSNELAKAGAADAERLARLVLDASFGVAQKSIAAETLAADLKLVVARLLGPDLG
ncbi:TetR/AcrR family transcriptional regulator [Devosia marina]|uniref:TetR family transcriptional regulator n=1 Tax=Devosia marina TaxID=2683198 RepID=A0A7X3FR82_9HYPH|nr:TetR/AcrR family transcriptional regulator [Devosia marina]MVS99279.1 TetR family transcriptional regulator [Devosia marina]